MGGTRAVSFHRRVGTKLSTDGSKGLIRTTTLKRFTTRSRRGPSVVPACSLSHRWLSPRRTNLKRSVSLSIRARSPKADVSSDPPRR